MYHQNPNIIINKQQQKNNEKQNKGKKAYDMM